MIQRTEAHKTLRRTTEKFGDAAQFLRTWAEKPLQLGSVTPSSRYLSRAVASYVDPKQDGPVIEIGAGTGPVTEALIKRGIAESRLVLIEYSHEFCALLRRRFPKATVIQGDAYALSERLAGVVGDKTAAATVCGLPLHQAGGPAAPALDAGVQGLEAGRSVHPVHLCRRFAHAAQGCRLHLEGFAEDLAERAAGSGVDLPPTVEELSRRGRWIRCKSAGRGFRARWPRLSHDPS